MEKRYLTKKMGERDLQETKASAGGGFMTSLATFIVDKRNLFFLLTILMLVFSAFSRNWVEVESELAAYLPSDSQTRQALDVMEEQFTTYGTAQIMAANISQAEAEALQAQIAGIKGVQGVEYDNTEAHYNKSSALYTVTFDYDEPDEACLTSLDEIRSALSAYDLYVSTELGNAEQEAIDSEVSVIMVYVAVIIVLVLLFTSQTYAEVPVLILTFVVAMIMNLGTNFLLGKISFVSNSVTSILQLALSLDYAVIFCNRCKEEHQNLPIREAAIAALSKAIPEIGASSLTTIGGLAAMMFMQFKIGADMAVCLIKSILFALLSVFVVMPGLLVLFGKLMDKTEHRSFVPKIPFVGKFAYKTRFVMPLIFVAAIVLAFPLSQKCPYAYGESSLETPVLNETQIAQNMIDDTFTSTNILALMVPAGDYEKEAAILEELSAYEEVDSAMGIANVEAMDGCMLADKLTPREFAELTGLDYEAAQLVYAAYGASQEELGQVLGNLVNYQVAAHRHVPFRLRPGGFGPRDPGRRADGYAGRGVYADDGGEEAAAGQRIQPHADVPEPARERRRDLPVPRHHPGRGHGHAPDGRGPGQRGQFRRHRGRPRRQELRQTGGLRLRGQRPRRQLGGRPRGHKRDDGTADKLPLPGLRNGRALCGRHRRAEHRQPRRLREPGRRQHHGRGGAGRPLGHHAPAHDRERACGHGHRRHRGLRAHGL